MKDLEKRRRVMQRSMRLGHCICDAKKSCPCDVFREYDVCQCAGERLDVPDGPVRLTRLVEHAGCASKIDQASLKRALAGLSFPADPRVLVGASVGDDAGVYQLADGLALVQTVDVFTPSVDDPYTFGQVAAANSVSDIYAMGGRPLTALSIVGFPIRAVPDRALHEMLRGGIDKMAEAGVSVIGGHSINDPEVKAGFAVTGLVDAGRLTLRAGARPGDVLVLTKPLGTGLIAFAAQIDRAPPGAAEAAARSMTALNRLASERMLECGAHGCTDVTGFGLAGHLAEMAAGSGVDVAVVWDDLPLLPGVLECLAQGIIPGGVERNRESCGEAVTLGPGVPPPALEVCLDPQTSGGLLVALTEADARRLVERLRADGVSEAAVIGRVRGRGAGRVFVETRGERPVVEAPLGARRPQARGTAAPAASAGGGTDAGCCAGGNQEEPTMADTTAGDCCCAGGTDARSTAPTTPEAACCAGGTRKEPAAVETAAADCCCADRGRSGAAAEAVGPGSVRQRFADFLKAASRPGALDAPTKQAIAIALSLLAKCEPCARLHVRKARQMGLSQDEIDEAAWMAIAFGGSPVMMLYDGLRDA